MSEHTHTPEVVAELIAALEPFAEACCHLHPSHPDDGLTMDGFKVADFRRAALAIAHARGEG